MNVFAWVFAVLAIVLFASSGARSEEDPCALPRAEGGPDMSCFAAFTKWYHNAETKQCEEFIWGGCGGNANRFETKQECEARCVTKS